MTDKVSKCRTFGTAKMGRKPAPLEDRYIPEPNSGCWLWLGATDGKDRGIMKVCGKLRRAPRVFYEEYVGPVMDKWVLHKCDNPLCVNPSHLFLGDQRDNMLDMHRKGRHPGNKQTMEMNSSAKLSAGDVASVRHGALKHLSSEVVAKKLGVSGSCVRQIRSLQTWRAIV